MNKKLALGSAALVALILAVRPTSAAGCKSLAEEFYGSMEDALAMDAPALKTTGMERFPAADQKFFNLVNSRCL